jgi:glutamyl-tRNA reductase
MAAHFYRLEKAAVAQHLCRVVSGLDSMMLGETEIFGQVKEAYRLALESGTTGGVLNKLFQRAFGIGKKVRTETSIQEGATSVGSVAVDLAEKIFGHLKHSEVMILGAGEMSRVTAQSLVSRGARSIFVANRSFDRAQELAKEMGGSAVRFDDWQKVLERVDVVISSTGAPHAIVQRADVEQARRARKYRPLFFIDIAVPRDIDPAVGEIEEVYLYDIDALEQLAEEARDRRQLQIDECERIILSELAKSKLPGL